MTDLKRMWVGARKGNSLILLEHRGLHDKAFALDLITKEFSIIKAGKRTVLGQLLKIDMSPEAIMDGVDIREGDKILLLPAGSGDAA